MAYDRFESRRGWREPRGRSGPDYGDRFEGRGSGRGWDRDDDDDRGDRNFFERAGDQIASWFGDEEPDRRYDRQPRFRDEGYRRPYTGRFSGSRSGGGGDDDRYRPMTGDYARSSSRDWDEDRRSGFTGMASTDRGQLHDPHYNEWRRQHLDALDRDYDEYRRENQSRFENEFTTWRTQREGKRQLLSQVREQMTVVGSDEEQLGTVDHVRGDRITLTKGDSPDGRHHRISCSMVDRVEGDRVILDRPAAEARRRFEEDGRSGFFRDDDNGSSGPHILNRSFSGTYER